MIERTQEEVEELNYKAGQNFYSMEWQYKVPEGWERGIYQIRNLANNTIYIGQSIRMTKRWNQHLMKLFQGKHRNKFLQADFDKYGWDMLEFTAIKPVPPEQLLELEEYHLIFDLYNANISIYNYVKKKDEITYAILKMLDKSKIKFDYRVDVKSVPKFETIIDFILYDKLGVKNKAIILCVDIPKLFISNQIKYCKANNMKYDIVSVKDNKIITEKF